MGLGRSWSTPQPLGPGGRSMLGSGSKSIKRVRSMYQVRGQIARIVKDNVFRY